MTTPAVWFSYFEAVLRFLSSFMVIVSMVEFRSLHRTQDSILSGQRRKSYGHHSGIGKKLQVLWR